MLYEASRRFFREVPNALLTLFVSFCANARFPVAASQKNASPSPREEGVDGHTSYCWAPFKQVGTSGKVV